MNTERAKEVFQKAKVIYEHCSTEEQTPYPLIFELANELEKWLNCPPSWAGSKPKGGATLEPEIASPAKPQSERDKVETKPEPTEFTKQVRFWMENTNQFSAAMDYKGVLTQACDIIEKLEAELANMRTFSYESVKGLVDWRDKRIKELQTALQRYGEHETGCMLSDACNCGLEQALKES